MDLVSDPTITKLLWESSKYFGDFKKDLSGVLLGVIRFGVVLLKSRSFSSTVMDPIPAPQNKSDNYIAAGFLNSLLTIYFLWNVLFYGKALIPNWLLCSFKR